MMEKRLLKLFNDDENISSLSCYSLPDGYNSAIFDSDFFLIRDVNYIAVTMDRSKYNSETEKRIIGFIENYIESKEGEIFISDSSEVPLLYVATRNSANLNSYKLVRKIER